MPAPSPDLIFQRPLLAGSPTDLVFGDGEGVFAPIDVAVLARLANTLTAGVLATAPARTNITASLANTLVTRITAGAVVRSNITANLANTLVVRVDVKAAEPVLVKISANIANTLTVTARGVYDNRVTPWLDQRVAAPHNPAVQSTNLLPTTWATSLPGKNEQSLAWALAVQVAANVRPVFEAATAIRKLTALAWQLADSGVAESSVNHQKAVASTRAAGSAWQLADTREVLRQIMLQTGVFKVQQATSSWQTATAKSHRLGALAGASLYLTGRQFVMMPWQTATQPRPGKSTLPVVPPKPVGITFNGDLLFECPVVAGSPTHLVFALHPCADALTAALFYILPARYYMTTDTLIARALPDMAPVPLYDCTLSADVGSFAWQFSASGPESLFAQLAPTSGPGAALPQRLQITVNGLVWVFMVESLKRTHSFGKRGVSISGRSQTALVGAPWAREASFNNPAPANAQQLAALALDLSGVALDWGITDWLVPADAWSYAGSRLAAIQAIANAAGGYVQSHRSAATLQVRHPYPPRPSGDSGGPWNWGIGAADVELAPDAIITSAIERRDGPDINAVYASGTTQGVLAVVKRLGTAGDKLGELQTDALITASQAAQQRGLSALGKAGAQLAITLELPVFTGPNQPGVIDVGSLVQVNESAPWRGRVRSVSVQTTPITQSAALTVNQTITLERHL